MYIFFIVLHVIACVGLVLIVLLQTGKGTGLSNVFGSGGGAQSVFGAQTGDVLTRGTAVLAGLFLITSISLAAMSMKRGSSVMKGAGRAARGERIPMMPSSGSAIPSATTQDLLNKIKEAAKGVKDTVQKAAEAEKNKAEGVKTEVPAIPAAVEQGKTDAVETEIPAVPAIPAAPVVPAASAPEAPLSVPAVPASAAPVETQSAPSQDTHSR